MEQYAGPFDPEFDLGNLSRSALAVLGREYLLAGHLQDRASMPQLISRYDRETMTEVAIDEWMGASPVYTRRMQAALDFAGEDVATIFKGIQLDIGAPHQFMDFRYQVSDDHHGEFWLDCCGALMDVEPMGEEFVVAMCHDIEDPTFDATAVATNPRARMRPIHRPPRTPPDREPHCRWRVFIDPDAEPLTETENCRAVARSKAATVALQTPDPVSEKPTGAGGRSDYSGAFDPDFQLEHLSHGALLTALDEVCLQGHILVHSLMLTLSDRFDDAVAREVTAAQFRGVAPVVARRIAVAMGIADDDLAAVAKVFQLHPAFRPHGYVSLRVEVEPDTHSARLGLEQSPAVEEDSRHSWAALWVDEPSLLAPVAQAVSPHARCEVAEPRGDEVAAWDVVVDPTVPAATEPDEVALTRFSTGADFVFIRSAAADSGAAG